MAEVEKKEGQEVTDTTKTGTPEEKKDVKETNLERQEKVFDADKIKGEALSDLFKNLGVDDEDTLKDIVSKHKEAEEASKTDLEKKEGECEALTKELASERKARILAEAKLSAIQQGAKPELVEDLVIVASTKVTKEKTIDAVIAEMKDSDSGKIYFASEEEEEKGKPGRGNKTVTRVSGVKTGKKEESDKGGSEKEEKHQGSIAERLLGGKKKSTKSAYFDN